jgi:hypothetical protein
MKSFSKRENEIKQTLDKINSIENMLDEPMYNIDHKEEVKVEIKIDNKIAHGKFIPSKAIQGIWYASEQTFRAMKKDLFATGGNIDEIIVPYHCQSCKADLDKQFWNFCPFCSSRFLE